SENKEFDQAPQFILYTLTTDSHANCNLVTINLTREITGQTSAHHMRSKSGLLNRWSSSSSQNSARHLQTISIVSEARFRSSRLTQKRKEERERALKKETKRAIP
ncbi:unnamed protein product, partial [Hymenolepis diminuta]